jgi:hypothetical protein
MLKLTNAGGIPPSVPARKRELDDPLTAILVPPVDYMNAVRRSLGVIDLDPCSTRVAQNIIDAQGFYPADQAEAALSEPWAGRVFLHPHPNSTVGRYQLQKVLRHYLSDQIESAIILTGKIEWLRQEPILLSFPYLIHYKRWIYWRWNNEKQALGKLSPSFSSATIFLPPKNGSHFDEDALSRFIDAFRSYGRIVIAEDLGDEWQQDALTAFMRSPIKPVLTETRIERY